MKWVQSSYCGNGSACVQMGTGTNDVPIRDSKDPDGPVLLFTQQQWAAFLLGLKDGEFDYTSG